MILAPIVEIFCNIDEFYKNHSKEIANKLFPLPTGKRQRKIELSESEMMTIMILFQLNHYRTFKDFLSGLCSEAAFSNRCSPLRKRVQ